MSDDLVKRARAALDGVTEGPWIDYEFSADHWVAFNNDDSGPAMRIGSWYNHRKANARFIAAARELVPAMADRIEELEAENNLLKTCGIVEIAVRNPRVRDYMQHWEGRAKSAEAKLAKAVEALSLTRRADDLREAYHRLPNDKNRIGDKRSKKSHARDAWLRAFRKSAKAARASLAELKGEK